jgi:hypothetical protein
MLAVIAFFLFAIAGILRLVGKHADIVTWLIVVGGLLVSAEAAWGWNRAGRTYRRG